ncbi:MAG: LysR family transcriptional regulator [Vagococcus salmoninarum]|uniref:LysR family transcriptional regulator n=1 Tax=Vagococcus salmoninarum TaxID=2739 RepID=UPI003F966EDD
MLDYRYYTFMKVYEKMNYTKAAEELHITQPTVSQHISYIEKKIKVVLFYKDKRKISASPAADYLYQRAKQLSKMSSEVIEELKNSY